MSDLSPEHDQRLAVAMREAEPPFPRQRHVVAAEVGRPDTRTVRPSRSDEVARGAVRVEHAGGRVDWSASWFSGLDLIPDAAIRATPTVTALELAHHRLRVLGTDAATTLGGYGVRAEAALLLTDDASGRDPEIKNSTVFAVVGTDRTFRSYFK